MDTKQRHAIEQNLRKLAEAAGFSDIYAHDYSGNLKHIKDYIYLNGEKYRPQDISLIIILSLVNLKYELLAFLRWPYYILKKLTILYAKLRFHGIIFSLIIGIYKTCALKQTSKRSTHTFCRIFWNILFINKLNTFRRSK